jgi:hypothetical protein
MASRPVRYYVVGRGDMVLADRSTWITSASNAKMIHELKSDLRVREHFAVMVAMPATKNGAPAGWVTERSMCWLPDGALDVRIVPEQREPSAGRPRNPFLP